MDDELDRPDCAHKCPHRFTLESSPIGPTVWLDVPRTKLREIIKAAFCPERFEVICTIFEGDRYKMSNNGLSICTRDPYGKPDWPYVSRIIDYLNQLKEAEEGTLDGRPTSKGFTVHRTCPDPMDFRFPFERRPARDRSARSGFKTGWIIDHRLEMIGRGLPVRTLKLPEGDGGGE
jgi:hypothetical protein